MADKMLTADEAWARIEAIYLEINGILASLPPEEAEAMLRRFAGLSRQEVARWHHTLLSKMTPLQIGGFIQDTVEKAGFQFAENMFEEIKGSMDRVAAEVKDRLTVKPRKTDRDLEIVRLRDEERLSFGKIPRRLLAQNPAWCKESGQPLDRDTVEAAYRRMKRRQSQKPPQV